MAEIMKLHSCTQTQHGHILVFSAMDDTRSVGVSIENGLPQDAIIQRIQNAFSTFNKHSAGEIAC